MDIFDHIQPETTDRSRFLVCAPKYLSTRIANNTFMGKGEQADPVLAMKQWDRALHVLEVMGVEFFEIPPVKEAQDFTFTANLASFIEPYVFLAKMKAPGRQVEEAPGRQFLESLGYTVLQPPFYWEGWAELKPLNDKLYFAGYGQFTDIRAQQWIAERAGIQIIPIKEVDPRLYHLDTMLMVLDEENVMVAKCGMDDASYKAIKKVCNVIDIPENLAVAGLTNGLVLRDKRIYCSGCLKPEESNYRKAIEFLLEKMDNFGLSTLFFDTDSIDASGGDFSCQFAPITFLPNSVKASS